MSDSLTEPPQPVPTPEEADFFQLAGGWLQPHDRHVSQPVRDPGPAFGHPS